MASFDMKKLDRSDRIVAGASVVTLICLFLPWYGVSSGPYSASVSGFSTSYGWLGALLIIAAGAYLVALRSGSNMPKNQFGPGVTVLGLSLLGTVIVLIRWLTIPKGGVAGFSYGPQYGMYVTILAGIVQVVLAFRLFKSSGEKVPWEANKPSS
jgi:peptidoglycan/LPS O-acetylase OafA/YrhL